MDYTPSGWPVFAAAINRDAAPRIDIVYRNGSGKLIASCNRRSRTRMKCRDVSWFIGDLGYHGWASVWCERDDTGDPV